MPVTVKVDIDEAKLERAIEAVRNAEGDFIGPEFQKAGQQTIDYFTRDLRSGVAQVTGDLRSAISGKVEQVVGAEVKFMMSDIVEHNGYKYAGRLDRDGKLSWRSGKYANSRTFGWFSYILEKKSPQILKRYFKKALENAVERISKTIG